jgi:hypothetical protein
VTIERARTKVKNGNLKISCAAS